MSEVRVAVCGLLYGAVRNSDDVRENDSMIHEIDGELEKFWKKANVFESKYSAGSNTEEHDRPQSGQLNTQPRFETPKYPIIIYLLAWPNCTEICSAARSLILQFYKQ
jgi:hypothetical protein